MKTILFIITVFLALQACQDITPGYLQTQFAGYTLDSLVVKKTLDLTPPKANASFTYYVERLGRTPEWCISQGIYPTIGGEEYKRDKYGWPWTSTPIEGVEGTKPIYVDIKSVTTDTGDADKMLANLRVSGNGTFTLPVYSDVPVGRYRISLTFSNEGYTQDVMDVFTIIVIDE